MDFSHRELSPNVHAEYYCACESYCAAPGPPERSHAHLNHFHTPPRIKFYVTFPQLQNEWHKKTPYFPYLSSSELTTKSSLWHGHGERTKITLMKSSPTLCSFKILLEVWFGKLKLELGECGQPSRKNLSV